MHISVVNDAYSIRCLLLPQFYLSFKSFLFSYLHEQMNTFIDTLIDFAFHIQIVQCFMECINVHVGVDTNQLEVLSKAFCALTALIIVSTCLKLIEKQFKVVVIFVNKCVESMVDLTLLLLSLISRHLSRHNQHSFFLDKC